MTNTDTTETTECECCACEPCECEVCEHCGEREDACECEICSGCGRLVEECDEDPEIGVEHSWSYATDAHITRERYCPRKEQAWADAKAEERYERRRDRDFDF